MTTENEPTVDLSGLGFQVGDVVRVDQNRADELRGARLISPQQYAGVIEGGVVESIERPDYPQVKFGGNGYYAPQTHAVPAAWLVLVERPAKAAPSVTNDTEATLLLSQLGRDIEGLRTELGLAENIVANRQSIDLTRLAELASLVQSSVVSVLTIVEAASGNSDLHELVTIALGEAGFTADEYVTTTA